MSAYNKINGGYASENRWLLTDLLRGEWDYDGVVVSDWGAVHDPVEAVEAGTDLRMPGRPEDDRLRVAEAAGRLDHQALARVAQRLALLAERTTPDTHHAPVVDLDQHHQLTRRAAAESAVLLVNDGTLPLNLQTTQRLAVIGELARTPRDQGAGSSAVNPTRVVSGLEALTRRAETYGVRVQFASGYTLDAAPSKPELIVEARNAAAAADVVVLFLGLPGQYEAEGRDRTSIDLPDNQIALFQALAGTDAPIVVALSNGSAVTTASWRHGVSAIVEFWLTGQAHGDTIADVLLGDVNPSSGDDPRPALCYPVVSRLPRRAEPRTVQRGHLPRLPLLRRAIHRSGLSLRLRPFLHDLRVLRSCGDNLRCGRPVGLTADISVTNTGSIAGAEVVQLYVSDHAKTVTTPPQELRGFTKIYLHPVDTHQERRSGHGRLYRRPDWTTRPHWAMAHRCATGQPRSELPSSDT